MTKLKILIIPIIILLTGCADRTGKCVELTDGSGRHGIYEKSKSQHLIRMKDSGSLERYNWDSHFMVVDKKYCEDQ